MTTNTVMVAVPQRLYQRLETIAHQTRREVSEILLTSAKAMLTVEAVNDNLPPHIADKLTAMQWFSDAALWKATHPTLSEQQQTELSELTHRQSSHPLTSVEQTRLTDLLAEYDWSVLQRAHAFALLSLRGHQIPDVNMP